MLSPRYLFFLGEDVLSLLQKFRRHLPLKNVLKPLLQDVRDGRPALGELLQRRDDVQHEAAVAQLEDHLSFLVFLELGDRLQDLLAGREGQRPDVHPLLFVNSSPEVVLKSEKRCYFNGTQQDEQVLTLRTLNAPQDKS